MANQAKPEAKSDAAEAPFDRQAYLKEIREALLLKLGLPKGTKPEQVTRLLQIRSDLEKIKK